MNRGRSQWKLTLLALVAVLAATVSGNALAVIHGVEGPVFNLVATEGHISSPDGLSVYMWGFADNGGTMQYPGPTMIVDQGDTVVVTLLNELPEPVSLVVPGMTVTPFLGSEGLIAREADPNGGIAVYSFVADRPGTFMYHSGTRPEHQIEMGLFGALIVRPPQANQAYGHPDSAYDHEYLFLLSEVDPEVHLWTELGFDANVDNNAYWPVLWYINGRNAPDTMTPPFSPLLPTQPYNCMPRLHPGERILLRFIGAGRDAHPFHTHGNNFVQIARDAELLSSGPGAGADLGVSDFTLTVYPGMTADVIFTWTGAGLGWDMYGHKHDLDNAPAGNFPGAEDVDHNGNGVMDVVDMEPGEDPDDHGKPFPVVMPSLQEMAFGATYSGSPFLGAFDDLPPGEGGNNANAGFFYMWHSHNEREMVNNDLFPGGMMTMLIVEPHGVPIP